MIYDTRIFIFCRSLQTHSIGILRLIDMVSMIFKDISKDLNMVYVCFEGILMVLTMIRVRRQIRVVTKHLRLPSRLLKITRSR